MVLIVTVGNDINIAFVKVAISLKNLVDILNKARQNDFQNKDNILFIDLANNDSELNNHESEGMNTSSFGYLCFLFDTKVFPTHDDFLLLELPRTPPGQSRPPRACRVISFEDAIKLPSLPCCMQSPKL